MSWPDNYCQTVTCRNFPVEWLPAIRKAVDGEHVVWLIPDCPADLFGGYNRAVFAWAGTHWELAESFEQVTSVSLVGNLPMPEDLTAAVLTAKILA